MRTKQVSLGLVIVLAGLAPAAFARGGESWAGKIVIVKRAGVTFGPKGKGKPSWKLDQREYQVIAEKDSQLQVRQGDRVGWFNKPDAVLLAGAVDYFTGVIQKNSEDADAYHRRAWAWVREGKFDRVLKDLNRAIDLAPKAASYRVSRGDYWLNTGQPDKAFQDFDRAIRLDPKLAEAFFGRGVAWGRKRDYDRAIKDLDQAIRLDPAFAEAFAVRGNFWNKKGEYDRAIKDYDEAIRLNPKPAVAFYNRGVAWSRKGEYDRAIKDYTEAIRRDPKYPSAFYNRGFAWAEKKEYGKAIKDFDRAARLDPQHVRALAQLALLLATCPVDELRDGKRAVKLARRACELTAWKSPTHLTALAAAYAEAGQFAKAIRWQEKALEDKTYAAAFGKAARKVLELYKAKKPLREP